MVRDGIGLTTTLVGRLPSVGLLSGLEKMLQDPIVSNISLQRERERCEKCKSARAALEDGGKDDLELSQDAERNASLPREGELCDRLRRVANAL